MSQDKTEQLKQLIEETVRIHEMNKQTLETLKNGGVEKFADEDTRNDAAKNGISINYLYYNEIKRLRTAIESYSNEMLALLDKMEEVKQEQK